MKCENEIPDIKMAENLELIKEEKERPVQTLEDFLAYLQDYGIKTLSAEQIKKQLEKTESAIVTHKFIDGIRITKVAEGKYKTFTTNKIEYPHSLSEKFGGKEITIE